MQARKLCDTRGKHIGKHNMAMLAEPKRKQKWSNDPRNTNWTNGKDQFYIVS